MVTAKIGDHWSPRALLLRRRATAYLPILQSSDARDPFCGDHAG